MHRYPQYAGVYMHTAARLTTPLYLTRTMPEASSTPNHAHSQVVQQDGSTDQTAIVPGECLSPEDKMILYAVLQDIANELRRIKRERKKRHQTEGK